MALTKDHKYYDSDNDLIEVQLADDDAVEERGALGLIYLDTTGGAYVEPEFAAPLALNILGHDRPADEPVSTGRFRVGEADVFIADNKIGRDHQVNTAAALLTAVDAYDQRARRLASAEQRRKSAAASLSSSVHSIIGLPATTPLKEFTGDDIGKLREALGRFDASLAN